MFGTAPRATKTGSRTTKPTSARSGFFLAAGLIGLGLYLMLGPQAPAVPDSATASAVLRPLSLSSEANALPTKPIEDVHVGDRVLAGNPEGSADEPDVDPATWSQLTLVLRKEGVDIDIVFLRSPQWVQENQAQPGGTVWLDLPEMDACGLARVLAIGPCPPIHAGPGRVVTGTFAHDDNGSVLDLRLEGQPEPIGVTANHRIYSEDRHAFVRAGELKVGEHLRPIDGSTQVASLTPRPGLHRVYNLEVNGEHAYRVAELGIVVHNGCWDTARRNYWKGLGEAEAANSTGRYSMANIQRMLDGKAPRMLVRMQSRKNPAMIVEHEISMELHHQYLTQRSGSGQMHQSWNLMEVTPWGHEATDPYRHVGWDLLQIIKDLGSF